MIRIVAQSSLIDKPVSLEEVRKLLKIIDFKNHGVNGAWEPTSPINLEKILKYVSEYLNVPVDLIRGYSRQREVVFARQVAIYLGKEHSAATFQSLGYLFENRHYTAIIYNYKRIKKEMKNNPAIYNLIREIQNQLTDNPH
jgi:chromosomal replication initiator protein